MKLDKDEQRQIATAEEGLAPATIGTPPLPEPIDGFPDFGHLPKLGIPNTRDLGGLPAAGGKHIAKYRLIRSGALHHIDKAGAETLLGDRLERVVDFRTPEETKKAPDPAQFFPNVRFYHAPVFVESAIGVTHEHDLFGDLKLLRDVSRDPFAVMESMYVKALMTEEGRHAYSSFLEILLAACEGATLWHCSVGKDRAGLGAYLAEAALGVSEEDRVRDYLATNKFVGTWIKEVTNALGRHGMAKTADRDVDAFYYAQRQFIEAAEAYIKKEFGSVETYLAEALHFGPGKCAKLQALYLE